MKPLLYIHVIPSSISILRSCRPLFYRLVSRGRLLLLSDQK
ncbi:unnamed protein product [Brassica oleracea]